MKIKILTSLSFIFLFSCQIQENIIKYSKISEIENSKKTSVQKANDLFQLSQNELNYINAIEYSEKAIKYYKATEVYNYLGILYFYVKDYKKSEENYLKSLSINNKNYIVYFNLSKLYFFMQKFDKAKEYLDKYISEVPKLSKLKEENKDNYDYLFQETFYSNYHLFNRTFPNFLKEDFIGGSINCYGDKVKNYNLSKIFDENIKILFLEEIKIDDIYEKKHQEFIRDEKEKLKDRIFLAIKEKDKISIANKYGLLERKIRLLSALDLTAQYFYKKDKIYCSFSNEFNPISTVEFGK